MDISASLVKELRDKSGAGMMDCKKALMEANADMVQAMDILKEKGIAKAQKKSGRIASEGAVLSAIENNSGLLLELNCETDFAAKSPGFKNLSDAIANYFMKNAGEEGKVVSMEEKFYDDTVEKLTSDAVATIGENIKPRRFVKYSSDDNSLIHSYIHMGGKIGVMLEVKAPSKEIANKSEVVEMSDGIAMQIASMSPECIDTDSFPKEAVDAERKIFLAQVLEMGKPQNIAEKIVEGKVKKFVSENTLLEQVFVMNSDQTVKDFVKETSSKVGGELNLVRFTRFELGEGIEKKKENFAEEVASQIK